MIVLVAMASYAFGRVSADAAEKRGRKSPTRSRAVATPDGTPRAGEKADVATWGSVEPVEGFGAGTRGGTDGRVVQVRQASEESVRRALQDANKTGGAVIRFPRDAVIFVRGMLPRITAPRITIEGNGATLDGAALDRDVAIVDIRSHDVIVRDLRVRNGYDNLRVQGDDAYDVVIAHVSSTGARDDGITVGYGAHDVTVQYAFLAGNAHSFFCKYGATTDVSLHHTWMQKAWIRSPLFSGPVRADVRNVIVEDWSEWGARFEDGATGNVVASLFTLSPYAARIGGKGDSALRFVDAGPVFTEKNVFRGEATEPTAPSGATEPVEAPPVRTSGVEAMEREVRDRAGCLPRDSIDRAYIARADGWRVGKNQPFALPSADPTPRPTVSP
jgi:hypothetical protein